MWDGRICSPRHLYFAVPIGLTLALAGVASAAGAFDGTYKGSRTVLHTTNGCAPLDNITLVIKDNHFNRTWGQIPLSVDIANNGTFGQSGMYSQYHSRPRMASIKGKITAGNLEADLGDDYCMVHLSLKKI
jgi:hypothetical protein